MRPRAVAFAVGVYILFSCATAFAGNGISAITVQKFRGLTSVAVTAIVSGDDDSSAVLRIFQQWNDQRGGGFDTGMVMVRRPHGSGASASASGEIFEGRILWMTPGRTAAFFIQGIDDGGGKTTDIDTVSCAQVRPIVATGPVYYVNQATGNDAANDGLSPGAPEKTIGAAITDLSGSAGAGANGGIIIAPGEYHERIDLNFGTDGALRFIEGDGTNPDSTIICGALPIVEQGNAKVGTPISWSSIGNDSSYKTYFPAGDSIGLVVLGWSELLHRKASVKGLEADTISAINCSSATVGNEVSGWWWQNDTLYVKRRNGASPGTLTIHAGYRDKLIDVQRRNWRIGRLTFRFAGGILTDYQGNGVNIGGKPGDPNPSAVGSGIYASGCASSHSVSGLVVDSCKFYGLNAPGILTSNACLRSDSVTVTNCTFDGLSIGGFNYSAGKCHPEEQATQPALANAYTAFCFNTVTGCYNNLGYGGTGPADSSGGLRGEVCYNKFSNSPDDGCEFDVAHSINLLAQSNLFSNTGTGFSMSPCYTGPIFIFYNTIVNAKFKGVKTSGNTAYTYLYQNTFMSNSGESGGSPAWDDRAGSASVGLNWRNNILVSKNGAGVIYGSNSATAGNSFNYNLYDSVATTRLFSWLGTGYSFPSIQSNLSWEADGARAAVVFADTVGNKTSVEPNRNSAAIGMGSRITGVNTMIGTRDRKSKGKMLVGSQDIHPAYDK